MGKVQGILGLNMKPAATPSQNRLEQQLCLVSQVQNLHQVSESQPEEGCSHPS